MTPKHVIPLLDTVRAVETPEGVAIDLRVAGPVPRALCFAIDFGIRALIYLGLAIGLATLGRFGTGVLLIAFFGLEWFYPVLFEVYAEGATPGKRMLGLRVVHDDGVPVGWSGAMIRNLLRAVDFLPFFYGCGLVSMLLTRDFKRLGDLAARTVVVYREIATPPLRLPEVTPRPPPVRFTLAEQQAILAFAARVPSLTNERAEEIAAIVRDVVRGERDVRTGLLGYARHIAGER
ncbi:MAG: RDD family protein [Gammaproteobacteria bacterium]